MTKQDPLQHDRHKIFERASKLRFSFPFFFFVRLAQHEIYTRVARILNLWI